jgi:hypothetical protein
MISTNHPGQQGTNEYQDSLPGSCYRLDRFAAGRLFFLYSGSDTVVRIRAFTMIKGPVKSGAFFITQGKLWIG